MSKTGLNQKDAFTFVQARRFCVSPRLVFQYQLQVGPHLFLLNPDPVLM